MTGMMMAIIGGASPIPALAAINSPTDTYNFVNGLGTIVSDPVTCLASGGTPAYTYVWSRVSGSILITIDNPTSETTTFSTDAPGLGLYTGLYRCTVTDSVLNIVVATPDVTVELERVDFGVI